MFKTAFLRQMSIISKPEDSTTKTLVLGNLIKLVDLPSHSHGHFAIGVMKLIRRLSYFLHLYPQAANFPSECDVKSKKLE